MSKSPPRPPIGQNARDDAIAARKAALAEALEAGHINGLDEIIGLAEVITLSINAAKTAGAVAESGRLHHERLAKNGGPSREACLVEKEVITSAVAAYTSALDSVASAASAIVTKAAVAREAANFGILSLVCEEESKKEE